MLATADNKALAELRARIAQESFDFIVPRKEWHAPAEVARYIGMQLSFVYELIEAGKLNAHGHNAANDLKVRHKIHRSGVIAYLLKTATYEPADAVAQLCGLIDRLGANAAVVVAEHAVRHRNATLNPNLVSKT